MNVRYPARGALAAALIAATAPTQTLFLPRPAPPAVRERPDSNPVPLMRGGARVQQFYGAGEVGAARLTVRRIAFRYDGPTAGRARAHAIRRLTVRVGSTAKAAAELGSEFAANLTAPLVTGLSAARLDFVADSSSVAGPQRFGGPGGELAVPLVRPVIVAIPPRGCFAVELLVDGNTNADLDAAALDFHVDPANHTSPGSAWANGKGCPSGPQSARSSLTTNGRYEPGGSISVHGDGFPPGSPVVMLLTLRLLGQPFAMPSTTPTCWLYVDPATGLSAAIGTADSNGRLGAFGDENTLPLPKGPRACGAVLYVQTTAPTRPWSGNPHGVLSSNYRTVVVGCPKRGAIAAWHASHHTRSAARVASMAFYGGYALRID